MLSINEDKIDNRNNNNNLSNLDIDTNLGLKRLPIFSLYLKNDKFKSLIKNYPFLKIYQLYIL